MSSDDEVAGSESDCEDEDEEEDMHKESQRFVHPDIGAKIIHELYQISGNLAMCARVAGVSRDWRMAVDRWSKTFVRKASIPHDASEGHLVLLGRACPKLQV